MVKTPLYGGLDSTSGWGIRACGRLHGFGLWHKGTLSTRKDSFRQTWMLWVDFIKRKGWTFFKYREGGFFDVGKVLDFSRVHIYIYIYLINYYCIWCIYFHVYVFVFVCIILSYLHFGTSRIPLRFFPHRDVVSPQFCVQTELIIRLPQKSQPAFLRSNSMGPLPCWISEHPSNLHQNLLSIPVALERCWLD